MRSHPSRNFQNFLFQAELAGMQMAQFKRIAKDFDLFVKSAAINFRMASPGAAPPSSQSGGSDSQSIDRGKHDAPARLDPEPLIGDQGRRGGAGDSFIRAFPLSQRRRGHCADTAFNIEHGIAALREALRLRFSPRGNE